MGLLDSFKAFVHSVTTDDHYALYGLPYGGSSAGGSVPSQATASSTRLQELDMSLSHSLASSRNGSSVNVAGYRPGLRSSSANLVGGSGHEMQTFGDDGLPPLPSMDSLWDRIEAILEEEYPELEDTLNLGVSTADLNEFERDLAVGPLPVEVRQFYKRHDGQFRGGKPTGLLMGLVLLDIESSMEEYALWAKVAEKVERQRMALHHHQQAQASETSSSSQLSRDRLLNSYLMHQKSVPPGAVQPYYIHRGWVPIARDLVGNLIGLDLAPGPKGLHGQIILYGREFDTKVVVARSLQELIFQFVSDLESGNYQIDSRESDSDHGFLDLSRMDDYMIGDEDEDNGELLFFDREGTEFGKKAKLSYIEVLKRRALKKFGIDRVEDFHTTFTPQRIPRKHLAADKGPASKAGSSSSLAVDLTADLLKETLIDGKEDSPEKPGETATPKAADLENVTDLKDVDLLATEDAAEPAKTTAAETTAAKTAAAETPAAETTPAETTPAKTTDAASPADLEAQETV